MAVPSAVAYATVTVLPLAAESVAVNVMLAVPALPSVSETSLMVSDGAVSSFTMVPAPWLSAIVAFVAPDRFTTYVSLGSSVRSPTIGTGTVCTTCPGRNVSVPLVVV